MCGARGLPADSETRLCVPANIWQRLRPPQPETYFSNAVLRELVTVRVFDVLSQPLGFVAEQIKRAVSRVDNTCAGGRERRRGGAGSWRRATLYA
jgi:shikimate O-hydroxycinnamoyltransferase